MADVFGLPIDGPPEDWMAIHAVGTVVGINEHGDMEIWHFETEDVTHWEAIGMLESNLAIRKTAVPELYWEVSLTEIDGETDWEDED